MNHDELIFILSHSRINQIKYFNNLTALKFIFWKYQILYFLKDFDSNIVQVTLTKTNTHLYRWFLFFLSLSPWSLCYNKISSLRIFQRDKQEHNRIPKIDVHL